MSDGVLLKAACVPFNAQLGTFHVCHVGRFCSGGVRQPRCPPGQDPYGIEFAALASCTSGVISVHHGHQWSRRALACALGQLQVVN